MLGEFAKDMQRKYPDYCKAYVIGKSSSGTDLWTLTVSRKPDGFPDPVNKVTPSSLSPSFLYIGGMHGNEPLGRQLMVYLAEELCSQAGLPSGAADPEIDSILSSGSVHLLFALNPDGFDAHDRFTKNRIDLNRNFPDPILRGGDLNRTGEEEPETIAYMEYLDLLGNSLTGSTTLHEGALVFILPYDGSPSKMIEPNPTPDHELFQYLAHAYVDVQPVLRDSTEFPEGIHQGSAWYPLYGGIQDYTYLKHSVYATTIEMNLQKWPPESQLQQLWMQHRPSMYAFLKAYLCQGVTVQVDFPPGARKEDVVVSMLTPGMGRPTHFRDNVSHGVHYPVPAGTYSIGIDWGLGESKRSESLVATVEPGKRTMLHAMAPPQEAAVGDEKEVGKKVGRAPSPPSRVVRINVEKREEPAGMEQKKGGESNNPKPVIFTYVLLVSFIVVLLLVRTFSKSKRARSRGSRSGSVLESCV